MDRVSRAVWGVASSKKYLGVYVRASICRVYQRLERSVRLFPPLAKPTPIHTEPEHGLSFTRVTGDYYLESTTP